MVFFFKNFEKHEAVLKSEYIPSNTGGFFTVVDCQEFQAEYRKHIKPIFPKVKLQYLGYLRKLFAVHVHLLYID